MQPDIPHRFPNRLKISITAFLRRDVLELFPKSLLILLYSRSSLMEPSKGVAIPSAIFDSARPLQRQSLKLSCLQPPILFIEWEIQKYICRTHPFNPPTSASRLFTTKTGRLQ